MAQQSEKSNNETKQRKVNGQTRTKKTNAKKAEGKKPQQKKTERSAVAGKKTTTGRTAKTRQKNVAAQNLKEQKKTAEKRTSAKRTKKTPEVNEGKRPTNIISAPKKATNRQKSSKALRIVPLGGLDEIGKNITLYEYGNDMILVDCGMSFPDEDLPGVDCVIPDFTYVLKNKDKIRGMVVTHGHEDHIGGIPYLLKEFNVPIYSTRLTIGLISGKLREHNLLSAAKLYNVAPGETVQLGAFSVEFIHVNHSIPDACGFAIRCPAGTVVQTGDFKIDTTPIDDNVIDIARFAELGHEGVLALLSDSTNAERPGYTPSERVVGGSFSNLFRKGEGHRIIVATFSSNIHRLQQIIDEAVNCGRKVAVSGRSMINVVNVASEMGYLNVPKGVLIEIDMVKKYTPGEIVIITTGSQGEPMSALHRMAYGDHRQIGIVPGDMIIISATPIPGNEKLVGKVINELIKLGANVVYEKMYDVHVSGHACQEELKLMLSITKPKYFIPVHGEHKHLFKNASLATQMGMSKENILVTEIGKVIEFKNGKMKVTESVPAGRVLVDGLGIGDVGSVVLRDRKHLAEDGLVIVTVTMDSATNEVVAGPEVLSRGFVYVREAEQLFEDVREVACDTLESCYDKGLHDWATIKTRLRDDVSKFLYERTKRSPMILPIIMEI